MYPGAHASLYPSPSVFSSQPFDFLQRQRADLRSLQQGKPPLPDIAFCFFPTAVPENPLRNWVSCAGEHGPVRLPVQKSMFSSCTRAHASSAPPSPKPNAKRYMRNGNTCKHTRASWLGAVDAIEEDIVETHKPQPPTNPPVQHVDRSGHCPHYYPITQVQAWSVASSAKGRGSTPLMVAEDSTWSFRHQKHGVSRPFLPPEDDEYSPTSAASASPLHRLLHFT